MPAWKKVLIEGFFPQISTAGLEELKIALEEDSTQLLQNHTATPTDEDSPCTGACLVAYGLWKDKGLHTVREIQAVFGEACQNADEKLGDVGVSRFVLNHYDELPREDMKKIYLQEVNNELNRRAKPDESAD